MEEYLLCFGFRLILNEFSMFVVAPVGDLVISSSTVVHREMTLTTFSLLFQKTEFILFCAPQYIEREFSQHLGAENIAVL